MNKITDLAEWQVLQSHQQKIAREEMQDWFHQDPQRFEKFSLQACGILLDYSKNRMTQETLRLLCELARKMRLSQKINALFSGEIVNSTEKRPALHTALREKNAALEIHGNNIMPDIHATLKKMREFIEKIHQNLWLGVTQKPIRDIVNIGIGGSHLGPLMTFRALSEYTHPSLRCHFVSNIDSVHIQEVLKQIDPERTLFIISSKSFSTLETMTNAKTIRSWMQAKLGTNNLAPHFIAVTAAHNKALQFGIAEENIFPLWDWVGGRYSIWSAIGLPLALMIGMQRFQEFLDGAYDMDQHFRYAEFSANMPVIMGLLGVWYINFFNANSHAVIPYSHHLHYLRAYLQQLDMESNGKRTSHQGEVVDYATGPIMWGEQGCLGQHAFHQLLLQGQHLVPIDFILAGNYRSEFSHHHDILVACGLSQAQALMYGKTFDDAYSELISEGYGEFDARELAMHKVIPGNRPSNTLFLEQVSPYHLGALIALYEHKIFVQGVIWNINSFDQWGVELGKQLLPSILENLKNGATHLQQDASTQGLIQHYKNLRDL